MMNGAHIVMGYSTTAYLAEDIVLRFATELLAEKSIISSFFIAGDQVESKRDITNNIQKVLYVPEAHDETIFTPPVKYRYSASDVKITTNGIHDNVVWS